MPKLQYVLKKRKGRKIRKQIIVVIGVSKKHIVVISSKKNSTKKKKNLIPKIQHSQRFYELQKRLKIKDQIMLVFSF